ncbi:MAG: ThuA domain-containing protein [Candidatus Poribacteria bacterium]|nr:ThuA domain-containing protein [Candidatus Poribacteria bacterium]
MNKRDPEENDERYVVYQGKEGPGNGKHIVFISGDEEYRSEEALPMLAKILAVHHGFKGTVLFAIDPETGTIDPENQTNVPGLHHLQTADMLVLFTRFRELPDEQMKYIVDYTNAGKPIMGLRTATHAFRYDRNQDSPYAKYSFNSEAFPGGYGRQVLGETWISHHGHHGHESTRGIINEQMNTHPILKGVEDVWGPTDVYGINELTGDAQVLLNGQVLVGMEPTDEAKPHTSTMPLAWIKTYTGEAGNTSRVFCTTMGASVDLESEGLRRLLVNGCYWCMGIEDQIPDKSVVDCVGEYHPTFFGFGDYKKGMRPSDFRL